MAEIIVIKGKEEAKVLHEVDLKGWLDAGWKVKGDKAEKQNKGDKAEESKTEDGE